jgi:hypothetical protein
MLREFDRQEVCDEIKYPVGNGVFSIVLVSEFWKSSVHRLELVYLV